MQEAKRQGSRGATLATVLLLTVVVSTLAFALTGASVTNLHLSYRSSNSNAARGVADSTIAMALDAVLADNTFGTSRRDTDTISLPIDEGCTGFLTFHQGLARRRGIPYSTNNLSNDSSRPGFNGRIVPAHSLHLVSRAEYRGSLKTVEAIFHVPKFPYVLASSGPIETQGDTLISAIESVEDYSSNDDDKLRPGHVASNSPDSDAILLGPQTRVTGDAKSVGGIQLDSAALVDGQVKPNSGATQLPRYSVEDFDPLFTGKIGVVHLSSSTASRPVYEGWVRQEGDLYISGGLELDNGVLYVNGNLVVSGGVTGRGALLVNGDVQISGRSNLESDNLAALVAEGRIHLQGGSGSPSVMRGLVYTNTELLAQNMTLIGAILVNGDNGALRLIDSNAIYSPDSVEVEVSDSTNPPSARRSPSGGGDDDDDDDSSSPTSDADGPGEGPSGDTQLVGEPLLDLNPSQMLGLASKLQLVLIREI